MHKKLSSLIFVVSTSVITNMIAMATFVPVHAITTIPKSKYEIIATFTNDNYMTQGGVVTRDYYVYTDCGIANAQDGPVMNKYGNTRHCTDKKYNTLHIVNRNTCTQKTSNINFGYISGIALNDWNSNKITFGSSKKCMQITNSGAKKVSSCKVASKSISTGVSNSTQQGLATEYNGYLYKVSGTTNQSHPIAVVNMSTKKKKLYKLAEEKIGEPEQISIDGDTGEVYLAYNHYHKCKKKTRTCKTLGPSQTIFIRIDASVFKKYTGKNQTSNTPTCKGFNNPVANSHSKKTADDTPSAPSSPSSPSSPNPSTGTHPQSNFDGTVETSFFGNVKDDGSGCGVYMILNMIIDIFTYGIIIAAIIGVTISGITYLTAKDNEQKTTKAKRRLYETIIGIVAYVVLYALLNLLLPGGHWNSDKTCSQTYESGTIIADSNNKPSSL